MIKIAGLIMNKIFIALILVLLPVSIFGQNINGRLSSNFYTFERFDSVNTSETYIRSFQQAALTISKDKFSLRTRMSFETDIANSLDNDPRLRFYNLYVEGRDLFDVATIRLGRQPFFNTVAGGVYDAVSLKLKHSGISLSGFYGGIVPPYQKLELTDEWGDNYVLGGSLKAHFLHCFYAGVSYVDKNIKSPDYYATRLDENFNPMQRLIESKSNQFSFLSAEAGYDKDGIVRVDTKFEYDLNFKTASKFEVSARYEQVENLGINVYYNYREPIIRYNSIFSVFDFGHTQEIEGGLDYRFNKYITAVGKFANVTYEDDDAQRLTLGVNSLFGSVTYRKSFGAAGEMDALSIYTARSFFEGFLTPSLGLSYTSYKLSPEADTNDITALLAGCNVRPLRELSFDLQGQYFNNKIYQSDFRLLFKINYWFNTNVSVL